MVCGVPWTPPTLYLRTRRGAGGQAAARCTMAVTGTACSAHARRCRGTSCAPLTVCTT